MIDLMKNRWLLLLAAMLLISVAAPAQTISADSVKTLNNNNKMLRMAIAINDQKIQLAKLQYQLLQQSQYAEKAAATSRKLAGKNEDAASKLSNDDLDAKKAKTAKKAAREAESASSDARDAQEKVDRLKDDVQRLEKKITTAAQELTEMGGARYLQ